MIYITHNKNDFSLSAWLWTCPLIIAVSVEPLYVTDKPSTPRPKLLINPNNLFAISCAEGSAGVAGAACGSAGAVFFLPIPFTKSKDPLFSPHIIVYSKVIKLTLIVILEKEIPLLSIEVDLVKICISINYLTRIKSHLPVAFFNQQYAN